MDDNGPDGWILMVLKFGSFIDCGCWRTEYMNIIEPQWTLKADSGLNITLEAEAWRLRHSLTESQSDRLWRLELTVVEMKRVQRAEMHENQDLMKRKVVPHFSQLRLLLILVQHVHRGGGPTSTLSPNLIVSSLWSPLFSLCFLLMWHVGCVVTVQQQREKHRMNVSVFHSSPWTLCSLCFCISISFAFVYTHVNVLSVYQLCRCGSVDVSGFVHHFGPVWNISTTIGWLVMKFGSDFGDPQTSHLAFSLSCTCVRLVINTKC